MKKHLLLSIAIVFVVCNHLMGQIDYQKLYEQKIQTYTRMKTTGWTMTGIGSGFAIAGAVLIGTIPDSYWNNKVYDDDDYTEEERRNDTQLLAGVIFAAVGVGLLAGGITVGSIGSHKVTSYKTKLNNLSVGVMCTPRKQGLTLTYRF
jgi:hypothetical protein